MSCWLALAGKFCPVCLYASKDTRLTAQLCVFGGGKGRKTSGLSTVTATGMKNVISLS